MTLLENLPDRCTIRRRVRTKDDLAGSRDSFTNEQTGVRCWEQGVSAAESAAYQKRGMELRSKVYFVANPNVTARHQIVITSRNGVAIASASQVAWDVLDSQRPDVSVGRQILWRVGIGINSGEDD